MADPSKVSILVVDDEPGIREIFGHFLRHRGHHVIACGTGEDALQAAQSSHFEVVILDFLLPDMSGLELTEKLKQLSPTSRIILLTGVQSEEIESQARQLEIFQYLAKPIRASALVEVVQAASARSPSPAQVQSL